MNQPIGLHTTLLTRDGRKIGNAIVTRADDHIYEIVTDYGNRAILTQAEIETLFHVGPVNSEHRLVFTREVTRVITYRGPAGDVARQLGMSMPDGVKKSNAIEIELKTLDDTAGLLLGTADPVAGLLRRLAEVERERDAARLALRNAHAA